MMGVAVGVGVIVGVGVMVGVCVMVGVRVRVGVWDGAGEAVAVAVCVGVCVLVAVADEVGEKVDEGVGVTLASSAVQAAEGLQASNPSPKLPSASARCGAQTRARDLILSTTPPVASRIRPPF